MLLFCHKRKMSSVGTSFDENEQKAVWKQLWILHKEGLGCDQWLPGRREKFRSLLADLPTADQARAGLVFLEKESVDSRAMKRKDRIFLLQEKCPSFDEFEEILVACATMEEYKKGSKCTRARARIARACKIMRDRLEHLTIEPKMGTHTLRMHIFLRQKFIHYLVRMKVAFGAFEKALQETRNEMRGLEDAVRVGFAYPEDFVELGTRCLRILLKHPSAVCQEVYELVAWVTEQRTEVQMKKEMEDQRSFYDEFGTWIVDE